MKKSWKKPVCQTLTAEDLSAHIQVAARSWTACWTGVLR